MLNNIISFSLRNRLVVVLAALIVLVAGCWTAWRMEVDVFPDLNAPTVVVMTEAGGMAAEEVERLVTFPIETAVNGSAGVRRVRSSSTHGFSVVWVEFDWGTDIYRDRQIVSEKLATVADALPDGIGRPTLGPQSSIMGEVLFVGLTADSTSAADLRTLADWTLRPRLLAAGGVAQVSVLGGDVREYQVQLDPGLMRHYGVSLDQVLAATARMTLNTGGGVVNEYGNEYIVRGLLSTTDAAAMAEAVVKADAQGRPVVLADVARVRPAAREPRTGVASVDGRHGVLLTVTKQPGTPTLDLTRRLDSVVARTAAALPPDVKVRTDLYRQEAFINASVSNIRKSLVEGGIFVALVLFVFLMNARTTFISLVSIPLSLLVSVIVLRLMGLTVNTMSIGGMAIAIGSLVDDAIVDVENVFRHLRANRRLPAARRRPVAEVVRAASCEVRLPILNSTLIIVVSFLPLFFLSGLEGRLLVPLGVAFVVSLFASTLVALTLTPVLCCGLLGRARGELKSPRWVERLKEGYGRLLRRLLGHGRAVAAGVAVLALLTVGGFALAGRSFLPPFNEGSFTVNVSTLPGISLEESDSIGRRAERLLLSVPEVKAVARKTGRAELDEHALGVNVSEMEVPFGLDGRSRGEVAAEIRRKLAELPGVNVEVGQPISHRIDAMLSGTRANIAVKVFGPDLNRLFALGNEIKAAVAGVEGVEDLNVEQQVERPQITVTPRRTLLARLGISLPEFARYVQVATGGEVVSQVNEGGRQFDLTVKMNAAARGSMERIRELPLVTADGRYVPLGEVAEVRSAAGPDVINRENAERKVVVSANAAGRDLRSVVEDMKRAIEARVTLPRDYRVEYGGQFESEASASRTLLLLSLVSVAVILLLLFMQFRSWGQAVVVLLNLPLALAGGVAALFVSGADLSIPAIIGFISLFGIATRGGMLLVDRYNELRRAGAASDESVVTGSADRLLPIVMTALTSGLALIPLAVGHDLPGNEIQSPMAVVMLGGLLTSTLLNLVVIPVIYHRYCRRVPGQEKAAGAASGENCPL